jgi:hypothetical protein
MDICENHWLEIGTATCAACQGSYCDDCLVWLKGPDHAPLCINCALRKAGIRHGRRAHPAGAGLGR